MDIQRPDQTKKKQIRRAIIGTAILAVVLLVTLGLNRLEPAAPTVERETVWVDTVQRGPMLRQVRGPGTLVPEDVRWISTSVEGRVESIPALPGVTVAATTVLLEMTNQDLQQNAAEAEAQLKASQADYEDLKAQLDSQLLNQEAAADEVESRFQQAKLQAEADEKLNKDGLIPEITMKLSRLRAEQLGRQTKVEQERIKKARSSNQAQLAAQRARVDQMHALHNMRRRQVDSLRVRAGIDGVLQELPVQVGQRVTPGTNLARVARPEKLKAELRIAETQAKDVLVGQRASIDTRNGLVEGRVIRVAPSVQDGTVIVDVALTGPLPKGARPDLSIDGTIEIEKLDDVLYVGRPAYGQSNSKVELFKLVKDDKEAVRVPVELGRSSVNTIEIVSGLNVGDKVILSDTTAQDGHDRIRLN
jgi:HlyD family secretion protein